MRLHDSYGTIEVMSKPADRLCTYCGQPGASEDDHVIARQFFPDDERYRGALPKVPSCGPCNRAKQRTEDIAGVVFQFGDDSEASRRVLLDRVPRTLAKNRRLHQSLRQGLEDFLVRTPAGVLVPASAINLKPPELRHLHRWFQFVARGVFRAEIGAPLTQDHTVHLLHPAHEGFKVFYDLLFGARSLGRRQFADGHFQYAFASNAADAVSMSFVKFKSVNMFALTLPPALSELRARIASAEWKEPTIIS